MKIVNRLILAGVALFSVGIIQAQGDGRLIIPAEYVRQNLMGNNLLPSNIQGSPFLFDEFIPGKVVIKNDKPFMASLRYNAYQDEIQMKDPQNNTIALLKRDYIKVQIRNDRFHVMSFELADGSAKQGYLISLNEGKVSLFKRYKKIFIEGQEATSSYGSDKPAKLEEEVTYFLKKEDGVARELKLKKKELLNMLSDKESDLKAYISENKLKLKSAEEVVQLLNYYNSI